MSDLTFSQAREKAERFLLEMAQRQSSGELMIVDNEIVETETAWFFPYNTVAYLVRGDFRSALAGNIPLKVSRDGAPVSYGMPPQWMEEAENDSPRPTKRSKRTPQR